MKHIPAIKTVLLDMDGVLWHGSEPVIDIQSLFKCIRDSNLQAYCVTNNSTSSVGYHLERLRGFGVSLSPQQIITSAEATGAYLKKTFSEGGDVFLIGEEGIRQALEQRGFDILEVGSNKDPLAVIVGLDRGFNYRVFNQAVQHIRRGAQFLGTNPDLTLPTPQGPAPGAGSIIAGIEASSGKKAHIIGKPNMDLYSLALSRSSSQPGEVIMIGDRLETDILGAQRLGMLTGLVLTGISTREQAENWNPQPDIIAENAIQVIEKLRKFDEKPI